MNKKSHDIVIIGGGLIGSCIAYFLARAGQDVCVVDKNIGGGNSGRSCGVVRQNLRPQAEILITMRSIEVWKTLVEESDIDFEFRQHGMLKLLYNEETATEAKKLMESQRAAGLECQFLDRAEVQKLIPAFIPDYVAGLYSPSCGSAEPYQSCVAIARLAERCGARIYDKTTVTGIQVIDDKVSAVQTDQGSISTGLVINAAGSWSQSINKMVGYWTPGELCRAQLVVTEQLPSLIEPSVACNPYGYFRQTRSGNVLIGFSSVPVADHSYRPASYEALSTAAKRAATMIPRLRSASTIRTFTGFTIWTPDLLPFIGFVQTPKGFYIAAEFNGTGFAIGPGIGELVSEHVLTGHTKFPINVFNPGRFQRNS
jgi:sarcosine oxidase subunit beta